MASFKVISLNFNKQRHLSQLYDLLKHGKPKIVCLQEITFESDELSSLISGLGYKAVCSLSLSKCSGIAVLHDISLNCEIVCLEPGAIQLITVENFWSFMNIYAPSGFTQRAARKTFFGETLLSHLNVRQGLPFLVGDWNCVLEPIDTSSLFNDKKCNALKSLLSSFRYKDAFRFFNPSAQSFTFFRPGAAPSRLDRVYFPEGVESSLISTEHLPGLSDHHMIVLTLESNVVLPPIRKQSTFWKLNTKILDDSDFLLNFEPFWDSLLLKTADFSSISVWWEDLAKPKIRSFLQNFSTVLARGRRDTKKFLYSMLDIYLSEQNWEQVSFIRNRLKLMLDEESYGYVVRSRENSALETEKSSIYHVNRVLKKGPSSSLSKLSVGGQVVTDQATIESNIVSFFSSLYNGHHRSTPNSSEPIDTGVSFQPDNSELSTFLDGLGELSPSQSAALDVDLTLDELNSALKSCGSGKSPGLDGLPYEFYVKVKDIISPTLLAVFSAQLQSGCLIPSFREGATVLLNKVAPLVPAVNQLRPITLLCCDYKIMSKIVTARLNSVLPQVIKSGQLCSISHKNIHFGSLNILSTIEQCRIKNLKGYLVSFDIFKAYDKTYIPFICNVLRKMKFGDIFINFVKTMHTDSSTRFVLNNLSSIVNILQSLRQGDPLAMALFIIFIEPLLMFLKRNLNGLSVSGQFQKDEDYVDDISVFSSTDNDLFVMNNAFLAFESLTGCVLNRKKSKIMGLGQWSSRNDWPLPWLSTEPFLKIFGINFHPSIEQTVSSTWDVCLKNIKSTLTLWSSRIFCSILQKVFVINTFVFSKLWYLCSILYLPRYVCEAIEKLVRKFLWAGMIEKLPYDELYCPRKDGGLALPCLQTRSDALFLSQMCRMLATDGSTKKHLQYWIKLSLPMFFINTVGPNCQNPISYFKRIVFLVKEAIGLDLLNVNSPITKCKTLYKNYMSSPPQPKIMDKIPDLHWPTVWARLHSVVLPSELFDVYFRIIHDIYPNRKRLFRMGLHADGLCPECRLEDDNVHRFTNCLCSRPIWTFVRYIINYISDDYLSYVADSDFLLLNFPTTMFEKDTLFILFCFVNFLHSKLESRESCTMRAFAGFLKLKLFQEGSFNFQFLRRILFQR